MLGRHHSEETKRKMREKALLRKSSGNKKHGFCCDYPQLYGMWVGMKSRCTNIHTDHYADYGGRGISVCEEWNNAENFCKWALENGYKKGLQLDRKDNDKGYSPDNCRWVTAKENTRNRRNTVFLTINGVEKCVSEWCESIEIPPSNIYYWVKKGGKEYAERRIEEILKSKHYAETAIQEEKRRNVGERCGIV